MLPELLSPTPSAPAALRGACCLLLLPVLLLLLGAVLLLLLSLLLCLCLTSVSRQHSLRLELPASASVCAVA